MIRPAQSPGSNPGFYVGFSRLTGQAALLAAHQPGLMPLIWYLRELEGLGTYRLRPVIWPDSPHEITPIQTAAFGLWVKGEAVINEAIWPDHSTGAHDILHMARLIGR
jgi:hypothetical protein